MSASPPSAIERLGVIGAGQMGRGIAQLAAMRGMSVTLVDSGRDVADRGRSAIAAQLGQLVEKKKVTSEDRDAAIARIAPADIYGGDLENVDFVVEAATESPDVKREIFTLLDQSCRPGVILATNTSSISITAIGAAVDAAGSRDRHALHEPAADHEAGRDHPRPARRRTRPTRRRARSPSGWARPRSSRATSPASSSTAS